MSVVIVLPLVGLLVGLPGLPGIPGVSEGLKGLKRLRHGKAAPLDSLPPAWRPASRLALENQFILAGLQPLGPYPVGLKLTTDPRKVDVSFDPDSGAVRYATEFDDVPVGTPVRLPIEQFAHDMTRRNFERLWYDKTLTSLRQNAAAVAANPTATNPSLGGLKFELPSPLPKRFQGLLGPGGPSLTVSGSENIRLSGQSNWTNQQIAALGQRNSLFPSLDMQQDLNIHLEGRLSDRVGVNLLQNSANQIPLANRVAINYVGDEDDLVQAFDLGNTNLTLPGTQYVSYSGKNEGLFGMKATTRLGPLDYTLLASKQEGRSERASYSGGSSQQVQYLQDKDYVHAVYFMFYDPSGGPGPGLDARVINETTVQLYLNEGTNINQVNTVRGRAYVDPDSACRNAANCPDLNGDGLPDTTQAVHGMWRLLKPGADQDYEILSDVYGPTFKVIRLHQALTNSIQSLAVTYAYRKAVLNPVNGQFDATGDSIHVGGIFEPTADGDMALTMKLIHAPEEQLKVDGTGHYIPSAFDATRELELKNFYQLAGQRIDPKSLLISIHQGNLDPPQTLAKEGVPYMQALGLDNFNETSGFPGYGHNGHDDLVDDVAPAQNFRSFIDYDRGTLWLPDLRPFAPRIKNDGTARRFDQYVSAQLFRGDSLVGADNTQDAANPIIYDTRNLLANSYLYTLEVRFTAASVSNEITLGRTNIIEGSDVVTVSGRVLQRDVDYRIDYDLGRVTMIRALRPEDQLNIDYSYAPLFQQAGKTLIGNAFRWEGRDINFGGAALYESKGAQDLRPRLGEEPSRSVIADLNSEWRMRPFFLTRLANMLPGVRTSQPSELNIQAELGTSFPNPNTQNQIYIDDMEGIRDAVTLSMNPERWRWSSIPLRTGLLHIDDPTTTDPQKYAEIHWYSPLNAVKEREFKPSLTQAQGSLNTHPVLALSLPRRPLTVPDPSQPLWSGLTQPIDPVGIDLTRSQFIEVWVNDFRDYHNGIHVDRVRGRHVKLHLDLGAVDEDQQRAPDEPPNGRLDSEDVSQNGAGRDGKLEVNDQINEDTGLDNELDGAEPGPPLDLVTASASDPHGDDFHEPDSKYQDLDPRKWLYTNGTEGDKNVVPVPETEDLNNNGGFDQGNNYFEYTVTLGDTAGCDSCKRYLASDIHDAFPQGYTDPAGPMNDDNGWRRYRIPISDSLRVQFGAPDLSLARHVRIWLEDVIETDPPPISEPGQNGSDKGDGRPFVMIGGIEIVGARWVAVPLDQQSIQAGTTMTLNTVNTLDQADIYEPPFDPGQTRNGNQELTRREQSMALEFTTFVPNDTLEVYKTFSLDEDYTRYGSLDWFVATFDVPNYDANTDTLDYFMRFDSDERGDNYYEYRARLPASSVAGKINWKEVRLPLTQLSNLKLNPGFPVSGDIFYQVPGAAPGELYTIVGRPSFTRLRRISIGLINASHRTFTGQAWFDELRAVDVAKDTGIAKRVSANGRLANLGGYAVTYNTRDANFQSVGESRGAGYSSDQLNFTSNVDLHRFIEGTRILLPFTYSYNSSGSSPRFTAGDDVVRTGSLASASDTRTTSQAWTLGYSRAWGERTNPFLKYTVGGITANFAKAWSDARNPTNVAGNQNSQLGVGYNISPRAAFALRLPFTGGAKFYPLPERFYWNYSLNRSSSQTFDRVRDSLGTLVPRNFTNGEAASLSFGADTRPFDFFHHAFQATRNLSLPKELDETVGGLNMGRVVNWSQTMDSRIAMQKYGPWMRPTIGWRSSYTQNNGPEISPDMSQRQVSNQQGVTLDWELPFDRLVTQTSGLPGPPSLPGQPRPPAPTDSLHRVQQQQQQLQQHRSALWRRLLARLGAISTNASYTANNSQSRLTGTPNLLYLVGLSNNYASTGGRFGATPAFGNIATDHDEFRVAGRTALDLGLGIILQTRGDVSAQTSSQNGVANRREQIRFPDLDLTYGRLTQLIGMDKILQNSHIKTHYGRTQTLDYLNGGGEATGISTQSEWSPLIDVGGDLKNGTRTAFTINRRVTQTENRLNGTSLATDRNTTANFSVNRTYTKGQKVTVLGKETSVKSNINLGMTAAYEKQSGETVQGGGVLSPTDRDRLSVNAQGGYSFSNNVTGTLELGFGQTRDLVQRNTTRSLRVELRAQFTF
jgi:hypothetical protein